MPPLYVPNPKHRNKNPQGSQWTISQPDEIACFNNAEAAEWLEDEVGWGLHRVGTAVQYLGKTHDGERDLFVAKFVASSSPVVWHGYPADHQRNTHDIPAPDILKLWERGGVLPPAKIRKLTKGQACRL